jgi:hypothetical protein
VSSFASTQVADRFYANDEITLAKLQEPLTQAAVHDMQQHDDDYALCIHDWSCLAVSDRQGQPLAPVAQRLLCSQGNLAIYDSAQTSAPKRPQPAKVHLDEVTDWIDQLERQPWPKPLMHIIDSKADSVRHRFYKMRMTKFAT